MWSVIRGKVQQLGATVAELVTSKKHIGRDKCGNEYFLFFEKKGEEPKRIIKYANDEVKPESIPIEWHTWLRHMRVDAPSEQEIASMDRKRAQFQDKVAEIEARDAKARLQHRMAQQYAESEAFSPEYIAAAMQRIGGAPSQAPTGPPPPPTPPSAPRPSAAKPVGSKEREMKVLGWKPRSR